MVPVPIFLPSAHIFGRVPIYFSHTPYKLRHLLGVGVGIQDSPLQDKYQGYRRSKMNCWLQTSFLRKAIDVSNIRRSVPDNARWREVQLDSFTVFSAIQKSADISSPFSTRSAMYMVLVSRIFPTGWIEAQTQQR